MSTSPNSSTRSAAKILRVAAFPAVKKSVRADCFRLDGRAT